MYAMNRIEIGGHLTEDPEIRYTSGDKPVCIASMAVAVNRGGGAERKVDFIDVKAIGASGIFAEKYLKKGRQKK